MFRVRSLAAVARNAPLALRASNNARIVQATRFYSAGHEEESFETLTERYVKFFDGVDDIFELQRGLNNCFAYDMVPSPTVIESALKASRRVNDFATAVENEGQYKQYLDELKAIKEELGVPTREELGI
ncbi:COX5A-domain-containing protein [Basidiobolus meristosporus CBS 931.73]|uniref:Cytochrome c oxidase subunit 6, mitochondrial n=1 Tax=Basidiobolus meristosporus CBS 931.73 TaxID=1314790 RepID=A0A1Y1Z7E2_9FUNG|nr:COX5A-domain-containing protein [Basidiobolus meristosporus CBS 931.73]|eukprot:ORY06179.1 COX5A-domain-containing protein [Basidiobolus meristosporus CBS 931.73]